MVLSLVGCDVKTRDDVEGGSGGEKLDTIPLTLLGQAANQKDLNVIRDLLTQQGFDVTINMQPDRGAYMSQIDAGNYDITFTGWASISGNGDYATRGIFHSTGDSNLGGNIHDERLDALIDEACTLVYDESVPLYAEIEQILLDEAYIAPLYVGRKVEAYNKDVVDGDTIGIYAARAEPFERYDFVDESKRDTDTLYLWQIENYYTTADPIKSNENSTYMTNFNMYTRLVNFNDQMEITTESALSRDYAVAEGNQAFYFILRDDIYFAKVENKQAVDSGERVGGEDVIFSLGRAKDKDSVPNHATYSLHENIDTIELVTDLAELENTQESSTGKTVLESLSDTLDVPVAELVGDKNSADNASGKYQVIKITAKTAFPQMLNFLGHHSGSILSKSQVEKINTYDVATYDPAVDVAYGDPATVSEGPDYDNQIYASGPYILVYKNDYELVMQKNPNYMVGTEFEPKIKNITIKMIPDKDSALSSLRSGELHVLNSLDVEKDSVVEGDAKLALKTTPGIAEKHLIFNTSEKSVCSDVNVRKAIQNAMDQSAFIAVYENSVFPATSPINTIMDTGCTFSPDPSLVQGYLKQYFDSKK
jgi:peptide/nickel transport system substrate-binding protein